jgi:hypothetical protein
MAIWREKLFAWMLRNAASAMEFFRLPVNRVVELGSQVEIPNQGAQENPFPPAGYVFECWPIRALIPI